MRGAHPGNRFNCHTLGSPQTTPAKNLKPSSIIRNLPPTLPPTVSARASGVPGVGVGARHALGQQWGGAAAGESPGPRVPPCCPSGAQTFHGVAPQVRKTKALMAAVWRDGKKNNRTGIKISIKKIHGYNHSSCETGFPFNWWGKPENSYVCL